MACGWPGMAGKRLTSHPQEVRLKKGSNDGSKQGKTVYEEQMQSAGLGNKWVKCEQEQAESKKRLCPHQGIGRKVPLSDTAWKPEGKGAPEV